jgi:hypothetical protein
LETCPLALFTRTSNVMEMANGDYVVDERSSSGIRRVLRGAHDEAQAFCQHKALWPAAFNIFGTARSRLFLFSTLSTIRQ